MCILGYVAGFPGRIGNLVPKRAEDTAQDGGYYVAKPMKSFRRVWITVVWIEARHSKYSSVHCIA